MAVGTQFVPQNGYGVNKVLPPSPYMQRPCFACTNFDHHYKLYLNMNPTLQFLLVKLIVNTQHGKQGWHVNGDGGSRNCAQQCERERIYGQLYWEWTNSSRATGNSLFWKIKIGIYKFQKIRQTILRIDNVDLRSCKFSVQNSLYYWLSKKDKWVDLGMVNSAHFQNLKICPICFIFILCSPY